MESQILREHVRHLYQEVISRSSVEQALERHIDCSNNILRVAHERYSIAEFRHILVVAAGKAAVPMCRYFVRLLRPCITSPQELRGVISGPLEKPEAIENFLYFAGGHPFPNLSSQTAATAVCDELRKLKQDSLIIFLISGGASAMLEMPLDGSLSLAESIALHKELVYSGLPIDQMNVIRKHFSAVKGGRLASLAGKAKQCSVLISDVPGDTPHLIGSGPSLPDPSTRQECLDILRSGELMGRLPQKVIEYFESPEMPETPKPGDGEFSRSAWVSILSNESMIKEASMLVEAAGYRAIVDSSCDNWPVEEAAKYLLRILRSHRHTSPAVCVLSGGEVTVKVPESPGTGGRNQHFALYCATRLADEDRGVVVLSAGSDGIDGSSPAAGGIVDWTTSRRADSLGLDLKKNLDRFDSYSVLNALGDVIHTGPTGNNLRDIRMLVSVTE